MTSRRHTAGPRHTVYEMVDQIRARPGAFLGDARIVSLETVIAGMHWAGAEDGGNCFGDFSAWYLLVTGRVTQAPWADLEAALGEGPALTRFLEYLDRFRACSFQELAYSDGPFTLQVRGTPQPAPSSLCLFQYRPEAVFGMLELDSDGKVTQPGFASTLFPSAELVKQHAFEKWGARAESWHR